MPSKRLCEKLEIHAHDDGEAREMLMEAARTHCLEAGHDEELVEGRLKTSIKKLL